MPRTKSKTKNKSRGPERAQIAKALSHPLRVRLLTLLNEGVASPKELAEQVGESLSLVSYHIRILRELGCIELVETAHRRGAIEHFYRPLTRPWFGDEDWATLPKSARESLSGLWLGDAVANASASIESGTMEQRPERHLSWTELDLDEAGWKEINGMLAGVLDRALELQAKTVSGRAERGAGIKTGLILGHFERAPVSDTAASGNGAPKRKRRSAGS